jgi:tryptophan halogenase
MKVDNIVIVGGGTSGWLAAAYLHNNHPDIEITVIDKEVGTPVGVGEGTLLQIGPFLSECGFEFSEWFPAVDATYKSAILFANWQGEGKDVWHPFYKGNRAIDPQTNLYDLWSQTQELDFKKIAMAYYDSSVLHNSVDANNLKHYGYHIDCSKLVQFIQQKLKNKVKLIKSDVVDILYNNESITSLTLKNNETISADIFVDCTGFKGILKKTNKRINLEGRLFCNTAIAGHIPYKDRDDELHPYVISEAVDHGWIWNIPVSSRIGSGLVFNRNITDIEEAKEYFVNYWDHRITKENCKVIDWTPFYNEDMWSGNIVSVGLSAGFIEPLESTGIALITSGVTQLSNAMRTQYYTNDDVDFFNLQMKIMFEDCVDFVSMHYANNNRDTKFWSYVKNTWTPSEKMSHYLDKLADPSVKIPNAGKFHSVFDGVNWAVWLIQMGFSVASRNTNYNKHEAENILTDNYLKNEKHRHVWSRHHASEIDRLKEYFK